MSTPLLIDLAGVARLAGVQRPVASMWRSRFASSADPFPPVILEKAGRAWFDATTVAEWLARTGHGNNPDVREDAAVASAPEDFSFSDEGAVAELEALITLASQWGTLGEHPLAALMDAAAEIDPADGLLRTEIAAHVRRGGCWTDFADSLIEAAYSASAALALVGHRVAAIRRTAGSAGGLGPEAIALVTESVRALLADSDAAVTLDARDAEISVSLAESLGDAASLALPSGPGSRRVRRRLLVDGHWVADDADDARRSIVVGRIPGRPGDHAAAMLNEVDEIALGMRTEDAAVVIGPARVLVDALTPADDQRRADILRSGRVRSVVRLPAGLVGSASRESLALWLLGAPVRGVANAERVTAIADLTGIQLTPAACADVVSDVVASMRSRQDLRAHHFRFARFASTSSLQARRGSLVASALRTPSVDVVAGDVPALIDIAADTVRADVAAAPIAAVAHQVPDAASVPELLGDGHIRIVPGTRLGAGLIGRDGLVVVSASDLDAPGGIGDAKVDQLALASQHPSAVLTRPGDVIFRTAPTAAAWVDVDGSKVVAYPARVLRITVADPGGLVPEVVAADITGAASGPAAWKRWMLRRVAPQNIAPLRRALADIAAARVDLEARAARLDDYATLIVVGATSGAVTMMDSNPAADAASPQ